MSKIKLVSLEQYTRGTAKRYQHLEYGLLLVTVLFGSANGGGADTIYFPFPEMQRTNLRRRSGIDPHAAALAAAMSLAQQPKAQAQGSFAQQEAGEADVHAATDVRPE